MPAAYAAGPATLAIPVIPTGASESGLAATTGNATPVAT